VAIFCYTVLGVFSFSAWPRAHEGSPLGDGRLGRTVHGRHLELRQRRLLGANLLPQWLLNFSTYLPLEPIVSGSNTPLPYQVVGLELRRYRAGHLGRGQFVIAQMNFTWNRSVVSGD